MSLPGWESRFFCPNQKKLASFECTGEISKNPNASILTNLQAEIQWQKRTTENYSSSSSKWEPGLGSNRKSSGFLASSAISKPLLPSPSRKIIFSCAGRPWPPKNKYIKQKKRFGEGQRITDFCCFKSKSKALSSMSRMISRTSISWCGKTQAPGAFWAHPGCDPTVISPSKNSSERNLPIFPSKLGMRIFFESYLPTKSSNPNCTRSVDQNWGMLTNLTLPKLKFAPPPPKKNLRLWGGEGTKSVPIHAMDAKMVCVFAGFHVRHPTYLNSDGNGLVWQVDWSKWKGNEKNCKTNRIAITAPISDISMQNIFFEDGKSQIPEVILSSRIHPIHRSLQQTVTFSGKTMPCWFCSASETFTVRYI